MRGGDRPVGTPVAGCVCASASASVSVIVRARMRAEGFFLPLASVSTTCAAAECGEIAGEVRGELSGAGYGLVGGEV